MTYLTNESYDNETLLITKAKNGDEAAFTALVEIYAKRIYNINLRMLGKSEDAADITQEVLIKIYRYLGSFRGDSAFSTWVYRISVNSCRDALRAAYRSREMSFSSFSEDDTAAKVFEIEDISAVPERLYLEKEGNQHLLNLVLTMNPKYRIIIVLREIMGLSYQEIADAVDISIGTVKSRLNRARMALSQKIFNDMEQYPHICGLNGKEHSCEEVG